MEWWKNILTNRFSATLAMVGAGLIVICIWGILFLPQFKRTSIVALTITGLMLIGGALAGLWVGKS